MRSTPSARQLASQAAIRCRARPSGSHRPSGRVSPPLVATVTRDRSPAPCRQRAGDQTLVVAALGVVPAVRVGGVEQRDARVERRVQRWRWRAASSRSGSVDRRMQPRPTILPCSMAHRAMIDSRFDHANPAHRRRGHRPRQRLQCPARAGGPGDQGGNRRRCPAGHHDARARHRRARRTDCRRHRRRLGLRSHECRSTRPAPSSCRACGTTMSTSVAARRWSTRTATCCRCTSPMASPPCATRPAI